MKSKANILVIAEADKREKIEEHWKWIEENLIPTVGERFSMIYFRCDFNEDL